MRHGKQYTTECDNTCEYAKAIKENNEYAAKQKDREKTLEEIKMFLIESGKNSTKKHGNVLILTIDDLNQLVILIKKMK